MPRLMRVDHSPGSPMRLLRPLWPAGVLLFLISCGLPAYGSDTPPPTSVTIPGSLQSELGCPGDWQPECASTALVYDAADDVWQATYNVPAGSWEYKAALNNSWAENYGGFAQRNGPNIPLNLAADTAVKFYYDHETHWVTDNVNSVIVTAVGSFQSEVGCPGDWQPDCLRSWLQDPDDDGVYTMRTSLIPAGNYEAKITINESWDENYGEGGVPNGPNIPFTVPASGAEMLFSYDANTHILTVEPTSGPVQPSAVTVAGSLQSELGCPGDWQPECDSTKLAYSEADTVWMGTFNVPAGNWEYKAALDNSWAENYGQNAMRDGPNIPLSLAGDTPVTFFYSHETHWITDNVNSRIVTAVGSFQSELGAPGDWQPDNMRSWLQDPDGDGVYAFCTSAFPPGSFEGKITVGRTWDENYGEGGVRNGANIPFTVPDGGGEVCFTFDSATNVPTITVEPNVEAPTITCPAPITVDAPEGTCEALVPFDAPATGNPAPTVEYRVNGEVVTSPHLFPVGMTLVTATATSDAGTAECTFTVTVTEKDTPTLVVKSEPIILWPPNHQYATFTVGDLVELAADGCDGSLDLGSVVIVSVTSDEEDDAEGEGDGNTVNDIVIAPDARSVQLRAERSASGDGRTYTITLSLTDASGNVTAGTATVLVPHSNTRKDTKPPKPATRQSRR